MVKQTTDAGQHTKPGRDTLIEYNLRVPEKMKTKDWYAWIVDSYVPYNTIVPKHYNKTKRSYDLLNNDLTRFKEEMDRFCRNAASDITNEPMDFEDMPVMYNRIYSKASYLVGQLLKRSEDYEIMPLSQRAQEEVNEEFERAITASLDAAIDAMIRGTESPLPPPQTLRKNSFQSKYQLFLSRVIRYFKYKFNTQELKRMGFWHTIASDQVLIGIVEEGGKPVPVIFNPLFTGYHKSNDRVEVEKGDYIWNTTAITFGQFLDECPDATEEEMARVATFSDTRYSAKRSHAPSRTTSSKAENAHFSYDLMASMQSPFDKHVGQGMGNSASSRYNQDRLVYKTYFQFKAYREVIFLTTIDEYGMDTTTVVPSNYDIPKSAVKVKFRNRYGRDSHRYEWSEDGIPHYAERLWIPRRYEVTRYGSDVFKNYREMPNQPINLEDPYGSFELSIKGRYMSGINAEPISLVERAINSQMQYIFAKQLESKEMAKYEGVTKDIDASLIPDDLHLDEDGEPLWPGADKLAVHRYLTRKLGINYYNGAQNSGGFVNPNKSPGTKVSQAGYFQEIINIQNFCNLLDTEIGLQMMVPPQAEAIISPSSNVGDNKLAIQQGYTMAEGYYVMFENVFKKVVNEYLRQFQQYYRTFFRENPEIKQVSLYYISTEGQKEVFEVTREMIDYEDMGLFLHDTSAADRYRQYMESVAVPLVQSPTPNGEQFSEIFRALSRGDSPERIHAKIVELAEKQRAEQERMQMQALQSQEKVAQLNQQTQQMAHRNELEKIQLKGELDIIENATGGDADEIPKALEQAAAIQDMEIKEREQQRKERETAQKTGNKSEN